MIRSARGDLFKKRFSKLDFLKTVLVIIIANSDKMKMKKSHLPMTFAFPLPSPFWFPPQIFLKFAPSTQFFGNFISPFKKRGETGRELENYVYSSKNLYNISIFDSFCEFLLEHFHSF